MQTSTDNVALPPLRLVEEHLDRIEGLLLLRRELARRSEEPALAATDARVRAHLAGLRVRRDEAIRIALTRLHSPAVFEACAAAIALLDLDPSKVRGEDGAWRVKPSVSEVVGEFYRSANTGGDSSVDLGSAASRAPVLELSVPSYLREAAASGLPNATSARRASAHLAATADVDFRAIIAAVQRDALPFVEGPSALAAEEPRAVRTPRVGSGTVDADFSAMVALADASPIPFAPAPSAPVPPGPGRPRSPLAATVDTDFSAIAAKAALPFAPPPQGREPMSPAVSAAEGGSQTRRASAHLAATADVDFRAIVAAVQSGAMPFAGSRPGLAPEMPRGVCGPRVGSGTVDADLSAMVALANASPMPFEPAPSAPLPPDPPRPRSPLAATVDPDAGAIAAAAALPFAAPRQAGEPMSLEVYAAISGAIARGEPRAAVLSRHGMTELQFQEQTRAWDLRFQMDPALTPRFRELVRRGG